jgi:hypothetical protein
MPQIAVESTGASGEEPLRRELLAFVQAVRDRRPVVTGQDGRRALALALRVLEAMAPVSS